MNFLDNLQTWLEGTEFYNDFLLKMPAPLNNIYFVTILLAVLLGYGIYRTVDGIQMSKRHRAVKQRQLELREKQAENEIDMLSREKEARSQREEINQMLRLMELSLVGQTGKTILANGDNIQGISQNAQDTHDAFDTIDSEAYSTIEVVEETNSTPIVVVDDTKQKELEYKLYHDGLTGVKNATAYQEAIENLSANDACIVSIDVNGLKAVNDKFGHKYGDILIKDVAEALADVFGLECTYRNGGDEFIVLLSGEGECIVSNKVKAVKDKLAEKTKEYETDNYISEGFVVSCAMGVTYGDGRKKMRELLDEADQKMYEDKKAMKKVMKFILSHSEEEAIRLEEELKKAKSEKQFVEDETTKKIADIQREKEKQEATWIAKIEVLNQALETEKVNSKKKVQEVQEKLDKETSKKQAEIEKLQLQVQTGADVDHANEEIERLRREMSKIQDNANKQIVDIQSEAEKLVKEKETEVSTLTSELETTKASTEAKISKLSDELDATKTNNEAEIQRLYTELKSEKSSSAKAIANLNEKLKAKEDEISSYQAQLVDFKSKADIDKENRERQIEELKTMLENAKSESDGKDADSISRIQMLKNALAQANTLNEQITKEKDEEVQKLTSEVEIFKTNEEQNKAEIIRLTSVLEETEQSKNAELTRMQNALNDATKKSEEEANTRQLAIDNLTSQLKNIQSTSNDVSVEQDSEVARLTALLDRAKTENEKLNSESKEQIATLTSELKTTNREREEFITQKQDEIDELQSKLDTTIATSKQAVSELTTKLREVEETRNNETEIEELEVTNATDTCNITPEVKNEKPISVTKPKFGSSVKPSFNFGNTSVAESDFDKLMSQFEDAEAKKAKIASAKAEQENKIRSTHSELKELLADDEIDVTTVHEVHEEDTLAAIDAKKAKLLKIAKREEEARRQAENNNGNRKKGLFGRK